MKYIATYGYSKSVSVVVGVNPSAASVTDTGVASLKVKAGGQGVLKDGHGLMASAITDPGAGATIPDAGPYSVSFTATATKVKADGSLVLRTDDETGTINAFPQIPGSPPIPFPVTFKYKISSAGQTKVQGN